MNKKEREARRQQEDMALNRGLIWVGGAIVLEALLLFVNRYYINYNFDNVDVAIAFKNVMAVGRIAAILGVLGGLVWCVLRFRKSQPVRLSGAVCLGSAAVFLCCHVALKFKGPGVQMLFMLVPALAGLALIYYLYQRELFPSAAAVGLSVLGLWFVRFGGKKEAALALIAIAAIAAAVLWLKKNGGIMPRKDGEGVRLLSKKTNYTIVLASCVAGLAAVAASMALGANIAYYLLFVMVVWLFGLLVYYTVKMM